MDRCVLYRRMLKRIFAFVIIISVFCFLPVTVFAADPRLNDGAGLLSSRQQDRLLAALDEVSVRQNFDIAVVTVQSLDGSTPMQYADDYYDSHGYLYDGALLLVYMNSRDWYISTSGFGTTAITDAGREYMSERFLPYLSDGEYYKAFEVFVSMCDDYVTQARSGNAYDTGNLPKKPFNYLFSLFISVLVGFAAALICVTAMKGKLKSVKKQSAANSYIKQGSLNITDSRDMFLYSKVDKHARPQSSGGSGGSGTHVSSSGRTHGGGGGKF